MPITIRPVPSTPSEPLRSTLPLFIYFPGMDGTGELLRPQLAGLQPIFDIRCLTIPPDDLTGWGGLLDQAAQLISTEKQKFPLKPIYLCGESFGGCLALQLVAHFPHLCDRLILVNPASSAIRQPWMDWGASLTRWLPKPLYRLSTLALLPLLISQQRVSSFNQEALLMAMQSVSPTSAGWRISMLSNFLIEKLPLRRIAQPVLILASGADRLLPSVAEARRLVRHLSHARSVWLPESGHACLLEREVRLEKILESADFIRDVSNPILSHAC